MAEPVILGTPTPDTPPVEVTITVPGPYTATIKGGVTTARDGVNEALRGLAIAAALVHRDEKTGPIL